MSGFEGVLVSDPWLQSQFTQVELRGLKSKFLSTKRETGHVTAKDLPPLMAKLKGLNDVLTEEEIGAILGETYSDNTEEIEFETFLREYLNLQEQVTSLTKKERVVGISDLIVRVPRRRNEGWHEDNKLPFPLVGGGFRGWREQTHIRII